MEPSTFFLWRRRRNIQQPKNSAAAPRMATGIPRPRPTFWLLVRPEALAVGESGVDVGEDVEDGLLESSGGVSVEEVDDDVSVDVDDPGW